MALHSLLYHIHRAMHNKNPGIDIHTSKFGTERFSQYGLIDKLNEAGKKTNDNFKNLLEPTKAVYKEASEIDDELTRILLMYEKSKNIKKLFQDLELLILEIEKKDLLNVDVYEYHNIRKKVFSTYVGCRIDPELTMQEIHNITNLKILTIFKDNYKELFRQEIIYLASIDPTNQNKQLKKLKNIGCHVFGSEFVENIKVTAMNKLDPEKDIIKNNTYKQLFKDLQAEKYDESVINEAINTIQKNNQAYNLKLVKQLPQDLEIEDNVVYLSGLSFAYRDGAGGIQRPSIYNNDPNRIDSAKITYQEAEYDDPNNKNIILVTEEKNNKYYCSVKCQYKDYKGVESNNTITIYDGASAFVSNDNDNEIHKGVITYNIDQNKNGLSLNNSNQLQRAAENHIKKTFKDSYRPLNQFTRESIDAVYDIQKKPSAFGHFVGYSRKTLSQDEADRGIETIISFMKQNGVEINKPNTLLINAVQNLEEQYYNFNTENMRVIAERKDTINNEQGYGKFEKEIDIFSEKFNILHRIQDLSGDINVKHHWYWSKLDSNYAEPLTRYPTKMSMTRELIKNCVSNISCSVKDWEHMTQNLDLVEKRQVVDELNNYINQYKEEVDTLLKSSRNTRKVYNEAERIIIENQKACQDFQTSIHHEQQMIIKSQKNIDGDDLNASMSTNASSEDESQSKHNTGKITCDYKKIIKNLETETVLKVNEKPKP